MTEGVSEKPTRAMWLTLAAMTTSASMILVDQTAVPLATPHAIDDLGAGLADSPWILTANVLPLAAFMVLGGRLGDIHGLRKVFLIGAVIFAVATAFAGFAQDMAWMIAARAAQGTGAALMMPTGVAIVSSVFAGPRRGTALGILAGGSAFFAALGPVLGGLLTDLDWRLVFLINVPLAVVAIALTLASTPPLGPGAGPRPRLDYPGVVSFGLGIAAIVFGLTESQSAGWGAAATVVPLAGGVAALIAFVVIELRVDEPMIEFRLFRRLNFLAANISQMLAGMVELGIGFLLPFYLLLVVGIDPSAAGLALLPGTIPIILAGPLAGRAFDRWGGRIPLTLGYLVLAGSGVALAMLASEETATSLIPGLFLQGVGLGIILTVNDPTGLSAVPPDKQGEAAGIINTSEQFGGAIGIAALGAIELTYYFDQLYARFSEQGIQPTDAQVDRVTRFFQEAEQVGLRNAVTEAGGGSVIQDVASFSIAAHVEAFQLVFFVSAGISLVAAAAMFALVRKRDRIAEGPIFSRRSRWVYTTAGATPAMTKRPGEDG